MAKPRILDKFTINELSGVDRPAQEGARVTIMKRNTDETSAEALWLLTKGLDPEEVAKLSASHRADLEAITKRDFSDKERASLADSGAALPDGSYPIVTTGDLENAVRAIGRAKDPAKVKAHIISRAKTLGATDKLPDDWGVKKSGDAGHTDTKGDPMSSDIKKALGLAESATDAEVSKAVAKQAADLALAKTMAQLTDEEKAHHAGLKDKDADDFLAMTHDDRAKEMKKRAAGDETLTIAGRTISKRAVGEDIFAIFKANAEESARQSAEIAKAREMAENATFAKRAGEELPNLTGTIEKKAGLLKAISKLPEADGAIVTDYLKAAEVMAKAGFVKLGTRAPGDAEDDDPEAKLDKLAKDHAAKNNVPYAKAYAAVSSTEEGRQLYKAFTENRRQTNGTTAH